MLFFISFLLYMENTANFEKLIPSIKINTEGKNRTSLFQRPMRKKVCSYVKI